MAYSVVAMPAIVVIGLWILLQFISGAGSFAQTAETGGVAYMTHIGGFVAGFILTYSMRGGRNQARRDAASGYGFRSNQ